MNPSPNLRSVTEAALYPGVALIEGTNVSVGRGTDTPFELVGAPWIKSKEFAAYLNAAALQACALCRRRLLPRRAFTTDRRARA